MHTLLMQGTCSSEKSEEINCGDVLLIA
uniref:Uncharacterized protein n=1 Tax=Arundo donax TaxID=35708 RepID=A0A0A9EIA9_ARUDO